MYGSIDTRGHLGHPPTTWVFDERTDSDNELGFTIDRASSGNAHVSSYMSIDEARQVAYAILAAIGEPVNGPVVAPSGVTETRVKEIVREVMRDTFN